MAYVMEDGMMIEDGELKKYSRVPGVTEVTIPDCVTRIRSGAFAGCDWLTSVTIPESVTEIDDYAFYGCTGLKSAVIPREGVKVGAGAFRECTGLADKNGFIVVNGVLYQYIGKKTEIVIPDSVTVIGAYAMDGCRTLKRVDIPPCVQRIERGAFRKCDGLADRDGFVIFGGILQAFTGTQADVVIPDGVTRIEERAFYQNMQAERVTIPDSVTAIGENAFVMCQSLREVSVPDSVTEMGGWAFAICPSLEDVRLPRGLTRVPDGWLKDCPDIRNAVLPEGVTHIGQRAFFGSGIQSVRLPEGVTVIGKKAFANCAWLKELFLPDSVTEIGDGAFCFCSCLPSLVIPASVAHMGTGAFAQCVSLTDISLAGYAVRVPQAYRVQMDIPACYHMVKDGDYAADLPEAIKALFAVSVYLTDCRPEAEAYIRQHTEVCLQSYIDADDYETVRALFEEGNFITEENILPLLEYAIAHTQAGGDVQIQMYIAGYRHTHFPDPADPFAGMSL